MGRTSLIAFALIASSTAFACSLVAGDDAASQEADHTEGDPTFAQHDWLWANETVEEFEQQAQDEAANNWWGPQTAEFLPLDHPMTQRLQFWVDRLDDAFRSRYPDKLKATPRPKIIIRKSNDPNAWVSSIPIAWNVKTRVAGEADAGLDASLVDASDGGDGGAEAGVVEPPPPASELVLLHTGVVYTSWGAKPFERPHDADKLSTFVKFHNENFSKCRLESNGDAVLFSELCAAPNGGLTNRRGDKLSYYGTSTHVTITTAYIMRLLVEDRIVSTLSHELGHFYRSHINMPSDVVNYFYSIDATQAHKPAPDARYIEQTTKAREKIRDGATDWTEENALMKDQRLGFYTIEQEADEIALELLSKIGIPPSVAIDKIFDNLKMEADFGAVGEQYGIGWAECAALRENGWRDADGKLVTVPVGDPSNAHHNSCFRAFNMSREMAAHHYQVGERVTPPGEEWSKILSAFGAEVNAPPAPPPMPEGGAPVADAGAGDQ